MQYCNNFFLFCFAALHHTHYVGDVRFTDFVFLFFVYFCCNVNGTRKIHWVKIEIEVLTLRRSNLFLRYLQQRKMKPQRIILIRHGESKGNIDRSIYAERPDYALELSENG